MCRTNNNLPLLQPTRSGAVLHDMNNRPLMNTNVNGTNNLFNTIQARSIHHVTNNLLTNVNQETSTNNVNHNVLLKRPLFRVRLLPNVGNHFPYKGVLVTHRRFRHSAIYHHDYHRNAMLLYNFHFRLLTHNVVHRHGNQNELYIRQRVPIRRRRPSVDGIRLMFNTVMISNRGNLQPHSRNINLKRRPWGTTNRRNGDHTTNHRGRNPIPYRARTTPSPPLPPNRPPPKHLLILIRQCQFPSRVVSRYATTRLRCFVVRFFHQNMGKGQYWGVISFGGKDSIASRHPDEAPFKICGGPTLGHFPRFEVFPSVREIANYHNEKQFEAT